MVGLVSREGGDPLFDFGISHHDEAFGRVFRHIIFIDKFIEEDRL